MAVVTERAGGKIKATVIKPMDIFMRTCENPSNEMIFFRGSYSDQELAVLGKESEFSHLAVDPSLFQMSSMISHVPRAAGSAMVTALFKILTRNAGAMSVAQLAVTCSWIIV